MQVRLKICGITNPADAELAATLGADWIGLNFYANSPRFIDDATAKSIVQALPTSAEPVALFVNKSLARMVRTAHGLSIRTIQVHRDTSDVLPLPQIAGGEGERRWFRAFSVRDASDLRTIETTLASVSAPPTAILIDAKVPGMFGGTGQVAPWHLLADFQPGVPIILAGGLTPENVADAIRIVRPYAVDVASGVESSPGKKDADKMRRFIEAVRGA